MTEYQVQSLEATVNDIWYMIERTSDEVDIARYCGKLDGIRRVIEMFDLVIRQIEDGRRVIVPMLDD